MRLQPGCFGKVPLFADFVRHGPPVPELEALDEWLQEGIAGARQGLGASWEAAFEAMPPRRFIYRSRSTGRAVGGAIAASRDKAGRRFPVLVYAALDARPLGTESSLLPVLLGGFMERAAEVASSPDRSADLKAYLGRVDELSFEADLEGARRGFQDFAARVTAGAFWGRALGSAGEGPLYGFVQNLADALGGGAVPRYALRFPGDAGNLGMTFWLELCGRLGPRLGLPTLAEWGPARPGGAAGSTVVFDDLLSKYFLPVFLPDRPSPHLFPLKPDGAVEAARVEQARRRFGAALGEPGLPLAELLRRLGR